MTYADFAVATDVVDEDGSRGNLVFHHVKDAGSRALRDWVGYIAFERYDRIRNDRIFERLAPDMTFATAEKVVAPFPDGFTRTGRDQVVALSEVRQRVGEALIRLGLTR